MGNVGQYAALPAIAFLLLPVADHQVVDSFGVKSMIVLAIVGGCFELS